MKPITKITIGTGKLLPRFGHDGEHHILSICETDKEGEVGRSDCKSL